MNTQLVLLFGLSSEIIKIIFCKNIRKWSEQFIIV